MKLDGFVKLHRPGLECDEVEHNLILSILADAVTLKSATMKYWSLGASGACAVQHSGWPLVLGDLNKEQCHRLAHEVQDLTYPGVVGPEKPATWFRNFTGEFGRAFRPPITQQIYAIREAPRYPNCPGSARLVTAEDASLLADWVLTFHKEAAPEDPRPDRGSLEQSAGDGQFMFWIVEGKPVSMAKIARRTKNTAAINGVYTPQAFRRRGYAAAVTAAQVGRIFAEGKLIACLHADLNNPSSNRCYQKVGFQPVGRFAHHPLVAKGRSP